MTMPAAFQSVLPTVGGILGAMAVVAAIETAIPLHARGRWNRAHLGPNLALTFLTFAQRASALRWCCSSWQRAVASVCSGSSAPTPRRRIAVLALDFFLRRPRAMHQVPAFWLPPAASLRSGCRCHDDDPHLASVIRYVFLAVFACALGASPGAFAIYRAAVALNALLEHANLRAPAWLDSLLALVTTWPTLHKVHHSRDAALTDTNYGNLLSLWDRLFATFTPARVGASVVYGLEGLDGPACRRRACSPCPSETRASAQGARASEWHRFGAHGSPTTILRTERIGWLRAAVLGANDGIVSTASLLVGVAAAHAARGDVLVAGVAGLVAGAMSMAAGEYVSVSSQADTEQADLARERKELEGNVDHERAELAAIYVARGLDPVLAGQVADQLMAHDALAAHARDVRPPAR
jgi:hypothetical protein